MWIELTTGKDSFRAQGSSPRRNVQVQTFVRVPDDGEGRMVVPVFSAYQKKLKGFKETTLHSHIPATAAHGPAIGGEWFVNRHEVMPGTEILIEYRHRSRVTGSFGENIEYLLLIADPNAPLYSIVAELPRHHLAAVPHIFFEGRFEVIETDDQLSDTARTVWRDYLGLDDDFHVSDVLDPNQDKLFVFRELEARIKQNSKTEIQQHGDKTRLKIRRVRNVRTRH